MSPTRDMSSARRSALDLGKRARSALRQRLADIGPVERVATAIATTNQPEQVPAKSGEARPSPEQRRLLEMYERLRARFTPNIEPAEGLPTVADIERLQRTIVRNDTITGGFFRTARQNGNLEDATVRSTRMLLEDEMWGQARSFSQVMQRYDSLVPLADVCLALGAEIAPLPLTVRDYLHRNDIGFVLAHVPDLYFRSGFQLDPEDTAAVLRRALDGELSVVSDADGWIDIAVSSFAGGAEELAGRALDRADQLRAAVQRPMVANALERRSLALRRYLDRSRTPTATHADTVSFALLDHKHPDRRKASTRLTETLQTLAVTGQLARQRNVTFTGADDLAAAVDRLRSATPEDRHVDGPTAQVALHAVDRDAAYCAAVPDDTWVIWSGHYADALQGTHFAPPNPALRPIFVGLEIDTATLAAPGVVEYLRANAPVGALNWDTVYLLLAADIPAFFSGSVVATVAADQHGSAVPALRVEADNDNNVGRGRASLAAPDAPELDLGALLERANDVVSAMRRSQRVITPDATVYLAARGLGVDAEISPPIPWSPDNPSLVQLSDETFRSVHETLSDMLTSLLTTIVAGADPDKVYATWRDLCADDVAHARGRLDAGATWPELDFDPAIVSDAIRAASVVVERSDHSVEGSEVNVEFSLDGNYKHQLDVVLDSVVSRTRRPVRAYILCRDHGPADHERMAGLFPTVSFVWLHTDDVVYGPIAGKVPWASFATMDRTLLPLIAPDIDRIIHLDLDLLVLGDVGELFDWPMGDRPLAAIIEAQNRFRSGYDTIRRAADRLRTAGTPELAEEITTSVFSRHPFDFEVFNAGVMVMNLDRMRRDDFCRRFLPFVQYFGVNGQEVLNIYIGDDFERVDRHWNQLVRLEMWDAPLIAHWAGPRKPWKGIWVTGRTEWLTAERAFAERVAELPGATAE